MLLNYLFKSILFQSTIHQVILKNRSNISSLSLKLLVLKNPNIKPSIRFKTISASGFKARVSKLKIRSKVLELAIFYTRLPYGKLEDMSL